MAERNVAGASRRQRQRQADDLGAQRIERSRSRYRGRRSPATRAASIQRDEVGFVLHRLVVRIERRGPPGFARQPSRQRCRRTRPGASMPRLCSRAITERNACCCRNASSRGPSGSRFASADSGTGTGTSSRRRTRSRDRRAFSAWVSRASRRFGWRISWARASSVSRSPNSSMSCAAVLTPMPGTPGTLSVASPASAMHVDYPLRADAEFFPDFVWPDRPVVHRIEHGHAWPDELHQVLVGGDDGHLGAGFARYPRIGGDQVVRLPAFAFDAGYVEGAHRLADQRELRDQFVRRRRPVRLVIGVEIVAEGATPGIEDHRQMVGVGLLQQLHQHVDEAEHGVDRRAVRPGERRQLVEGAEDEARAVDQEDVAGWRWRDIRAPRRSGLSATPLSGRAPAGRLRPGRSGASSRGR